MPRVVSEIWDRATTSQPVPSTTVVALTGLAALGLILWPTTWRRVRLGVTAVHEGGHAVVGVLVGRRLHGIRLHADTSGLTVSRGRPTGPGMVFTLLAGYTAPALVGLGSAALLAAGYAVGLLWLGVLLMTVMLLWIRNVYGFAILVVAIAIAAAVSWYGTPEVQSAWAYVLVWLLLLGAPRPVVALLLAGRARSRKSDPDQLAALTHVPATVWILAMLTVDLAAAGFGATMLVPGLR